MERIEIDKNKPLNPGDIIELEFKTTTWVWFQAAEIAAIESYCSRRTDWTILSNYLPENNRITFKILIKEKEPMEQMQRAGLGLSCLYIAGVIASSGLVVWLVLDKCYQIGQTPGGQVAMAGVGSGLSTAGVAFLLFVIYKYFLHGSFRND